MGFSSVIGASSVIRPGVCTSTTRPSSPFDGQVIYETDTDLVRSFNGSSWVTVGPTTVPASAITAVQSATVTTSQTTTSTGYTDLATVGPAVTLTTSTSALVIVGGKFYNNNNYPQNFMSFAISGATTASATDARAAMHQDGNWGQGSRTACILVTGLTAGSNTFTAKYRVSSDTGTFWDRTITVFAL